MIEEDITRLFFGTLGTMQNVPHSFIAKTSTFDMKIRRDHATTLIVALRLIVPAGNVGGVAVVVDADTNGCFLRLLITPFMSALSLLFCSIIIPKAK